MVSSPEKWWLHDVCLLPDLLASLVTSTFLMAQDLMAQFDIKNFFHNDNFKKS